MRETKGKHATPAEEIRHITAKSGVAASRCVGSARPNSYLTRNIALRSIDDND
ncbi:hypothetical protein RC1_0753 [Rhodospirillum centenum SW]|uniref:Uncharacterized protein n=1 Tax=Rhodospirillum centenum (strain ATCC 51521 / SW) TaxID=414684 RepID=B6IRU8_RHOCS|nr:hypothetical protein RC1_0753 [Rhodospirillum centenum SW]